MRELAGTSFFWGIIWRLGLGCAALAVGACGDEMPAPAPDSTHQPTPTGQSDDGNSDPCGGIVGFACPAGKFCDFEGNCGLGDMFGKCRPMPRSCEEECTTKVCGCDGAT